MNLFTEAVRCVVDHCSYFSVRGWAYDKRTGQFPTSVEIVAASGETLSLDNRHLHHRPDLTDAIENCDPAVKLGFSVNLLDVFNARVPDYGIKLDGEFRWTFSQSAKKMADPFRPAQAFPREYGSKQVIIVHKSHGRLKDCIQAILGWQNNFLSQNVNSGVAYCISSIDELGTLKDDLIAQKSQKILFAEKDILHQLVSISASLYSSSLPVVLGTDIDLSNNAGGLLNVMCSLFDIPHGAPMTPLVLMRLVSAVSGYAPLFFPEDEGLYVYQSGAVEDPIPEIIRNRLQEKGSGEVVVISEREISRLNDIDSRHCLVTVRTSALRRSMDIFDLPTEDFVRAVFQRGLDVRVMKPGDF